MSVVILYVFCSLWYLFFARMLHLCMNADFKISHYTVEPARK